MKKTALLMLSICQFAFSCENQLSLNQESDTQNDVSALVLYEGDPAVDGCGWLLEINQVLYSPINLDSEFHMDSLEVTLSYNILKATWNCGWREPGYKQIEITKIKK